MVKRLKETGEMYEDMEYEWFEEFTNGLSEKDRFVAEEVRDNYLSDEHVRGFFESEIYNIIVHDIAGNESPERNSNISTNILKVIKRTKELWLEELTGTIKTYGEEFEDLWKEDVSRDSDEEEEPAKCPKCGALVYH